MKRVYLELICLHILLADRVQSKGNYLKEPMSQFCLNTPSAPTQEEYRIAESLNEAIQGDSNDPFAQADWPQVQ